MAIAALKMLTLDSSDAQRDATFWSALLGWEVAHAQDEYAMLTGPGGMALGFGTLQMANHPLPSVVAMRRGVRRETPPRVIEYSIQSAATV